MLPFGRRWPVPPLPLVRACLVGGSTIHPGSARSKRLRRRLAQFRPQERKVQLWVKRGGMAILPGPGTMFGRDFSNVELGPKS